MNKHEFLAALNEVYCRIACTKHGVGLVAVRSIPAGTDPFKNCDPHGDLIELPAGELDAYQAPEEAKKLVRDFCALQNGIYHVPDYGIDAIDKSYFLNHSKHPNMTTQDDGETFTALRDIAIGEELTVDYNLYHEHVRTFDEDFLK